MLSKEVLISKLEYIIEHIDRIKEYTIAIHDSDDYVKSSEGITLYDATMMRLQALGENLKSIEQKAPDILAKHAEIEWVKIIRLRDIISHHYEKIQTEIVYEICVDFIPKLERTIKKIIEESKEQ